MIADPLRDFLQQHIASYEHLEVLLLLRRHADRDVESRHYLFVLRLVAYVLIIVAVIDKSRRR